MATDLTFATVVSRAQGHLNDRGGTFWTSAILLPHAASAYVWAFNAIAKYSGVPFEKIADGVGGAGLIYVGNISDISAIIPADFYLPSKLEFRKTTSEEWVEIDRRDNLPSRETNPADRVIEWEFRLRTIFVNKANAGYLRLRYLGLLTAPVATSDHVLMDNLTEALGYATAAIAYDSRGQTGQSNRMDVKANLLMEQLTDILVKDLQQVARRGAAFSTGAALRPISRG